MNFEKLIQPTLSLIRQATQASPRLRRASPPTIILGLSGGPDSVFLFHVLKILHEQNHLTLHAAHLNHGWREDAVNDAKFCQELCEAHNIPITVGHANDLSLKVKFNGSLEEVGRKLRRHFFSQVLEEQHGHLIALAHHHQDQQETFFMRLLRGSSLAGLRCMDAVNGVYIRPLLHLNKEDILTYLAQHDFAYRTDPTNTSDNFLRNKIRKYLLPALKHCDNRFDQKFVSTLTHLKTEDNFLQELTQESFANVFTTEQSCLSGTLTTFNALPYTLQKRLIIHWLVKEQVAFTVSDQFIHEIIKFLSTANGGTHALAPSWYLQKKQGFFRIVKHS